MVNTQQHCGAGTFPYVIRSGDTFFSLANRFNTTVDAIMMANPGVVPGRLFIGQVICIPSSSTPPTPSCPAGSQTYIVRSGDTIFNLATRFNTTVDAILRANPGINPNNLQIGQVICIPTSTPPPPSQQCPTLSMGSRGPSVTELQRLLMAHGFNPGPIDGIFGNQTHAAVVAFQRSRGLVPDGIVGVQTWTALGVNCGVTPPTPSTCPAGSQSYTIRSGDTLYDLAIRFNTTVDAIMRMNPGINPNNLQIGQMICIPR